MTTFASLGTVGRILQRIDEGELIDLSNAYIIKAKKSSVLLEKMDFVSNYEAIILQGSEWVYKVCNPDETISSYPPIADVVNDLGSGEDFIFCEKSVLDRLLGQKTSAKEKMLNKQVDIFQMKFFHIKPILYKIRSADKPVRLNLKNFPKSVELEQALIDLIHIRDENKGKNYDSILLDDDFSKIIHEGVAKLNENPLKDHLSVLIESQKRLKSDFEKSSQRLKNLNTGLLEREKAHSEEIATLQNQVNDLYNIVRHQKKQQEYDFEQYKQAFEKLGAEDFEKNIKAFEKVVEGIIRSSEEKISSLLITIENQKKDFEQFKLDSLQHNLNELLWRGLQLGDDTLIKSMLKYGGDVNAIDMKKEGFVPIFWALIYNLEMFDLLLSQHPDIMVTFPENSLYPGTMIFAHIASKLNVIQFETVLNLVNNNDPRKLILFQVAYDALPTENDKTAFAKKMAFKLAKQNDSGIPLFDLVLSKGISMDEIDENKCSLLHIAAYYDNEIIVKHLLTRGADYYALNKDSKCASELGNNSLTITELFKQNAKEKAQKNLEPYIKEHMERSNVKQSAYADLIKEEKELQAKMAELLNKKNRI